MTLSYLAKISAKKCKKFGRIQTTTAPPCGNL